MYNIINLCLLCLKDDVNLKNISSKDSDGVLIEEKLRFFLFRFIAFKPETSKHTNICLHCLENLNHIYKFKQRCLQNIAKFNNFINLLNNANEPYRNLHVRLIDIKHLNTNQETRELEINEIKSEKNCFESNVNVKEDPNKDDIETEYLLQDENIHKTEVNEDILKVEDNIDVKIECTDIFDDNDNNEHDENVIEQEDIAIEYVFQEEHIQEIEVDEEIFKKIDNIVVEKEIENIFNNDNNDENYIEQEDTSEGDNQIEYYILQDEYIQETELEEEILRKEDNIDVKTESKNIFNNNDNDDNKTQIKNVHGNEGETMIVDDEIYENVKKESIDISDEIMIQFNIDFEDELQNETTNNRDSDSSCSSPCSSYNESIDTSNWNEKNKPTTSHESSSIQNIFSKQEHVQVQPSIKFNRHNKRTCCYYCKELVLKLPRHLIRNHSDEEKVREIKNLPVRSPRRKEMISELRKKGNFFYNHECLEKQSGNLIVKRRPSLFLEGSHYLPCSYCLGFYSKRTLFIHVRRCSKLAQKGSRITKMAKTLLPENPFASDNLQKNILPELRNDKIGKVVQSDNLILKFGSELYLKLRSCRSSDKNSALNVRQRMREVARLLIEIRKINPSICYLAEAFHLTHCNIVIEALTNLVHFSAETGYCEKSSIINKIRSSIIMCAEIMRSLAIKNENESDRSSLDAFIKEMFPKLKTLSN